jgi:2-polyprenyl-3-methyl-5-hydroxy-6-metoxy-1,4-benzoquinol methylase
MTSDIWDDPRRDFRERYQIPEHFVWDAYSLAKIDYEACVEIALRLLPEPPGKVLDVGCGDGWIARKIANTGFTVTGIDYSDRAIGFAKLLVPDVQFYKDDIRLLHERSHWQENFDIAVCIEVLEHVPPEHERVVLKGIQKCLKPDGIFVLSVPSILTPLNRWHYKHYRQQELVELLTDTDFEIQQIAKQPEQGWLASKKLWRVIQNRFYDLRFFRVILRKLLLARYTRTGNSSKARRYIVQAVKR